MHIYISNIKYNEYSIFYVIVDKLCAGKKRGIHINHIPKFKLWVSPGATGTYVVTLDYYASTLFMLFLFIYLKNITIK